MPPKQVTKDNEDVLFLLSCLMHVESISWPEIAKTNGIAGTSSVAAPQVAQRKFKRLVDGSGKFTLDKGKVTLKDQVNTASTSKKATTTAAPEDDDEDDDDNEDGEGVPVTPESPTPVPKSTGKKRGRPVGSTKKGSSKKAKVSKDQEEVTGDDDEA